jgi:hypothetical protein
VREAPAPHESPFALPRGREPILLHDGDLEIRYPDRAVGGRGRIELVLLPTPRFGFFLENVPVSPDAGSADELAVPGLPGSLEAVVGNSRFGLSGFMSGSTEGSAGDSDSPSIAEVRFLVANLPFFVGESLHGTRSLPEGGKQDAYWRGRLTLRAADWLVDLDLRVDHEARYARLKEQGGFEITHVGVLRRDKGTLFSGRDAEETLDALGEFLGLACGAWAPPIAGVGLDEDGQLIWLELKRRWTSPWRSLLRAFDLHKHELSVAFACYLARRNDPTWKEPLRVATQIYVEANGPITADTSLVLAQTLLELISWVRFVDELRTRQAKDFDGLMAPERLRELLAWLEVDPTIPPQQTALASTAASEDWNDGPHAIGAMRNALIHPRQRERLLRTPTMARIELQELALWYVELALLRLVDFNGFYLNRLGEKVTGIVEAVPWRHATCER